MSATRTMIGSTELTACVRKRAEDMTVKERTWKVYDVTQCDTAYLGVTQRCAPLPGPSLRRFVDHDYL